MSTPATFDARDQFIELAERRLYGILITEAERLVARIERNDHFITAEASMRAHALFMAARSLRGDR